MSTWMNWWGRGGSAPVPEEGPKQPNDGWRETLDTVVFVIVLVLILKTFVAECFVIPTGSMAETLYGYQKNVVCPECSHPFVVNASDEVENGNRDRNFCTCPNCLRDIEVVRQGQIRRGGESARINDPGATTGDRVLVGKFPADFSTSGPSRQQVVVFKYPGNSGGGFDQFPVSGPQRNHTPMNYIKRCMGLPNEVLGICGGDLYRLVEGWTPPADEGPATDWWQSDHMRVAYIPRVFVGPEGKISVPPGDASPIERVEGDSASMLVAGGRFEMIRKSPHVVLAEARLVYDDDRTAADMKAFPRWSAGNGNGFPRGSDGFYAGDATGGSTWLRYRHMLRSNIQGVGPAAVARPQVITDVMGYNTSRSSEILFGAVGPGEGTRSVAGNWVGDLMVEFMAKTKSAQGSVVVELARATRRYRALFDLATGSITLLVVAADGTSAELKQAAHAGIRGASSGRRIRFAHVDRTLHVWVDGKAVFGEGIHVPAASENGPRTFDLEPAAIGLVDGAVADIGHIRLLRDTYYTAKDSPSEMDVHLDDYAAPLDWSPGQPTPDNLKALAWAPMRVLRVPPEHYLCLGDNSTHSSDSRSWGTVPGRLMLGRALGVYWPLNRIGLIR